MVRPNGSLPRMQIATGESASAKALEGHSTNFAKFSRNAALTWYSSSVCATVGPGNINELAPASTTGRAHEILPKRHSLAPISYFVTQFKLA